MRTIPSHSYDFGRADVLRVFGPALIPLALVVVVLHLGTRIPLLPKPRAALDTDGTILFHQAEVTLEPRDANLLFVGDSSCLMDISVPHLKLFVPRTTIPLNLGTLSYLDLYSFSSLIEHYIRANPERVRTVVLLLSPEALRRSGPTEYHTEALQHFYRGKDYCGPTLPPLLCSLGVEIFRGRLLSRAVPQPLSGAYGQHYGFTRDLWNLLSTQDGSAIDPGRFDAANARGSAEYRLAKSLEPASRNFRAALPKGVRLVAGITPLPETFVGPSFPERYRELLHTWGRWLSADDVLTDLPATRPDDQFASSTHLNERGARLYTEQLARILARQRLEP